MNAAVERARSERTRSSALRERSELLTQQLVDKLRQYPGELGGNGDVFSLRLARLRPTVSLFRHSFRRWLEQRGLADDDVRDLTLAASEACANAVEHPVAARGAFEVEAVRRTDEIVVVVRDFGGWRPESLNEARGRGLQLIRSLMTDVDVAHRKHGTEIVMRRRLD